MVLWVILSFLSCAVFGVIYPETWVDTWLAPLDALDTYVAYATSRIWDRVKFRIWNTLPR